MSDPSDDHQTLEVKVTAAQIAENCPTKLSGLGKRITAHLEKAEHCDKRANDHRISAGLLLAQAKEACDEGGFAAFREKFFPNLGRSRAYELLDIATGKKTVEQVRAANAERQRKSRADRKAAAVRDVTDTLPPPEPRASRPPTTALQITKAEAQKAKAEAVARMFPAAEIKAIPGEARAALIEALGRLDAGSEVERQRAQLGLTWDELIVPAEVDLRQAA